MKTQRKKSVLLIGGLGNLGFQLGLKLQEAGHKVTILDLEAAVDNYILSSVDNDNRKLTELVFFKEGNFFKPGLPPKIIKDIPKFDSVVICVRTRESQKNLLLANPFSTEAIASMEENFRSTVIEPLNIIEKLICSNSVKLLQSSLIFTYSSNANQISHQSMGYHVINSAIQNLVQYLSISLRTRKIAVYSLELGVIDFKHYPFKEIQSLVDFPGTTINEIGDVIEFILNCNPLSLVGKSIAMTGGRALLDATAVAEQVFGDLKVRG